MKIKPLLSVVFLHFSFIGGIRAESKYYPRANVSFDDFKRLVVEVEPHRAQRLLDLDEFLAKSKQPETIILDTRSDYRFNRIHLKGARHLSFTDFTQDNLAKVIPSPVTNILIYCNNNFKGDNVDFASKVFFPIKSNFVIQNGAVRRLPDTLIPSIETQITDQAKPRMMALNIPTYVNLFGYGYENVYELDELVDVKDARIAFEGTLVKR